MKNTTIAAALLVLASSVPAMAQDISGASVTGKYKSFTEDDVDIEVTSLFAGIEVGLAPSFAIGGNLATFNFANVDDSVFNATIHGMYMLSPDSAIGLFVAQDSQGDDEGTLYGIEGGGGSANTQYEAYYGVVDSDDFGTNDLSIAGFNFMFNVGGGFSLGIDYESYTVADGVIPPGETTAEDLTLSDTALVGRYQFENGASVFAELGQISRSTSTDDTDFVSVDPAEYVAIGATYSFGRSSGNLLSNRTIVGFGG